MRAIGVVASEASEIEARVLLHQAEERQVRAEDLVLVENRNGNRVLAVLRRGLGSNENLRAGGYNPGVAYARIGGRPSTAKETYDFTLSVIGEVEDSVQQNKLILAPGSPVQVFEEADDPMRLLAGRKHRLTLGHYQGHPGWRVPIDHTFLPYHLGVFASTGGGKSFLARHQLIPLLREAGYAVLVLDWKGRDYAPHYPAAQGLSISEVALDAVTVVEYLTAKMGRFGYSSYGGGTVVQALESFIHDQAWRGLAPAEFLRTLRAFMLQELNPKAATSGRPFEDVQRFERGFRRLREADVQAILGTLTAADVVARARRQGLLVVDMKRTGKDEKLSMFLALATHLLERMQADEDLQLALVLDEAPQYCPFKPEGLQEATTDMLIDLCALGRTHQLGICLLSQGIAGEIGINAAVRRNLNTQFVGKIHPLDMLEASNWLAPFNIDARFLLSLPPGHFYLMGNLNPSPVPLLLTFQLEPPS